MREIRLWIVSQQKYLHLSNMIKQVPLNSEKYGYKHVLDFIDDYSGLTIFFISENTTATLCSLLRNI